MIKKYSILFMALFLSVSEIAAQKSSSKISTEDSGMKRALKESRKAETQVKKQKKNFSIDKKFALAREKYYAKMYTEALDILDEITNTYPTFTDAWFLKADIIRKQTDTHGKYDVAKEMQVLSVGLSYDSTSYPIYNYFLADDYYAHGKYALALETYEKYLRLDRQQRRPNEVALKMQSCNFALDELASRSSSMPKPVKYIEEEKGDTYGPAFDMRKNLFMYTVREKNVYKSPIKKPGTSIVDTIETQVDNENMYMIRNGRKLPFAFNMPQYNEGMPSITASGQQMYFSGCGGSDRNPQCDIFMCSRVNETTWGEPRNLGEPVSTDAWEAQPAISPDGRRLAFVSNRKGGVGGSDIWMTTIKRVDKGKIIWNEPECLWINTKGREMSPFIASDNHTLFFASDSYVGMGGLDIYYVDLDSIGSQPVNVGMAVNSNTDQSGLIIDPEGKMMYFASQDLKTDKIALYRTPVPDNVHIDPVSHMTIDIVDQWERRIIPNQLMVQSLTTKDTVIFYNAAGFFPDTLLTLLPPESHLLINVVRDEFEFYSDTLYTGSGTSEKPRHYTVQLKPMKEFESFTLKGIFFENNSSVLDSVSLGELQQLTMWLRLNPTVGIIVRGYTDNVGSEARNRRLSEDRAFEVYKYLLTHYIHKDRVQFEGYGSQYPCASNATPEGRAKNRRVEVYIENMYGFYNY